MPDRPFPLLGILGGGQLGRMTAMAAIRMGVHVRTLSPSPAGPVAALGDAMVGDWYDPEVLSAFAAGCDAITVESEWAPVEGVVPLVADTVRVYPTPQTLYTIRHKGRQKEALRHAGLPAPDFRLCRTPEAALKAASELGLPVVLKQFERSYDGFGNGLAREAGDIHELWPKLAADDGLLVEAFVDFRQELSVLVVRTDAGEKVAYPPAYTEQRDHRCHAVVVPADVDPATAAHATETAMAAADATGAVGVLGVELFETSTGDILLNELAPRPHNTGHYSIEGSHTSQFENHVRAVLGWPLGDTGLRDGAACMINILGERAAPVSSHSLRHALEIPGAAVHLYGKEEGRPTRKMGHVTVTGPDRDDIRRRAEHAAALIHL